jgi:hypothetical protein
VEHRRGRALVPLAVRTLAVEYHDLAVCHAPWPPPGVLGASQEFVALAVRALCSLVGLLEPPASEEWRVEAIRLLLDSELARTLPLGPLTIVAAYFLR